MFEVHQRHSMCQYFISFLWLNNVPLLWYMNVPHFCSFISGWTFGFFHVLAVVNNTAMNISVHGFVWTCAFRSLGKYLRVEFLGCAE